MAREELKRREHQGLSQRHRTWGEQVPATDVDLFLIEYDFRRAVALIEYKDDSPRPLSYSERTSMAAIRDVGDRARLPFYLVRYRARDWTFIVHAENPLAHETLPDVLGRRLSELEYVEFLYRLRGREVPDIVVPNLSRVA